MEKVLEGGHSQAQEGAASGHRATELGVPALGILSLCFASTARGHGPLETTHHPWMPSKLRTRVGETVRWIKVLFPKCDVMNSVLGAQKRA